MTASTKQKDKHSSFVSTENQATEKPKVSISAFQPDEELPEQELVRQVFQRFEVSAKLMGLYRYQSTSYPKFVAPTAELLKVYHDRFGTLVIKIKPFEFHFQDEMIYSNESQDNNLPYKFYREGFRTLSFEPGFGENELISFFELILQVPRDLSSIDLTTLLWKKELPHFSYLLLEGFEEDSEDIGSGSGSNDFDTIIEYLKQQLSSQSSDAVNFRGLAEEDLLIDETLASAHTKRGMYIRAVKLDQKEKQQIQNILEQEEQQVAERSIKLFARLLQDYTEIEQLKQLEEFILTVLEFFLINREFHALTNALHTLRQLIPQMQGSLSNELDKMQQNFIVQLSSPERLMTLFEYLETPENITEQKKIDLKEYLLLLGPSTRKSFFEQIANNKNQQRRTLLELFLDTREKQTLVNQLMEKNGDDNSFLVDLVIVGKKISGLFDLEALQGFVDSGSPKLQVEGLLTMASQNLTQAIENAKILIETKNQMLQRVATEVLTKNGPNGVQLLIQFMETSTFNKMTEELQNYLNRMLGQSKEQAAFQWFQNVLKQKSSFFKSQIDKQKKQALQGLIASAEQKAIHIITKSLAHGKHSKVIQQVMEQALHSLTQSVRGVENVKTNPSKL